MNAPIKLRHTFALLAAIGFGAIAFGQSVSADLHVPAARMLAAECQGFEALATVGGRPLTCSGDVAAADIAAPGVVPVTVPAAAHS